MIRAISSVSLWNQLHRRLPVTILILLLVPLVVVLSSDQSAAAQSDWSPPRTVYIPETGHTLDQGCLDQWHEAGGAAACGYPVTPEITRPDGTIVQYLQYVSFEYYPEGNAAGQYFALGSIGEERRPFSLQRAVASHTSTGNTEGAGAAATNVKVISAWLPVDPPVTKNPHIRYVEERSHTVRYALLDF